MPAAGNRDGRRQQVMVGVSPPRIGHRERGARAHDKQGPAGRLRSKELVKGIRWAGVCWLGGHRDTVSHTRGMWSRLRERLARLRGFASRDESPRLSDESRWYTEHTALLISTLKWALLGAAAGVCVGLGTRVFLWALEPLS